MQILNIYNNTNYNRQKINFGAIKVSDDIETIDAKLSLKALRLIKALDLHIENTWSKIKKGKIDLQEPKFKYTKGEEFITIKPIYGNNTPSLLIESFDGKFSKKLIFDRRNPNNFRYEKTVDTDYGSATLKSYDSRVQNDPNINLYGDNLITEILPQIIPTKTILEVFPKSRFSKANNGNKRIN